MIQFVSGRFWVRFCSALFCVGYMGDFAMETQVCTLVMRGRGDVLGAVAGCAHQIRAYKVIVFMNSI
jgi:hypothetical protein